MPDHTCWYILPLHLKLFAHIVKVAPMSLLLCPVCHMPLDDGDKKSSCANGHRFDRAREGYLNLLRSSKAGDTMGDPKAQARSRRDFLDKGYYRPLRDKLVELVDAQVQSHLGKPHAAGTSSVPILDICCGEGYYTSALGAIADADAYGFDLAKEMVRLAAKRGHATYFVANLKAIPVPDASMAVATHLFAPFNETEFARVLKPGGTLFTVVPGARHLFGLKQALYDTPYLNDEKLPQTTRLEFIEATKVAADITLGCAQDIEAVFQMTPYYYRTSARDKAKLEGIKALSTPIEFVIGAYRKP